MKRDLTENEIDALSAIDCRVMEKGETFEQAAEAIDGFYPPLTLKDLLALREYY